MRIILLMNSMFTGGAEFSTLTFYGWLLKQGYDVKLVVLKKAKPEYDAAQFGFDNAIELGGTTFWEKYKSLKKILTEFKPHLVHSILFDANILGCLCHLSNKSFFHLESLVNEMYSENRLADPQVTRLKLLAYRTMDFITQLFGVDHFHANGEAVAKHYQSKLFIDKKRISIIPRGRNSNSFLGDANNRKLVREKLETGNRQLFINMARHEYQKAQDVLLEALGLMSKTDLDNIQLVLIGREGKLTEILKEKITKYKLQNCVVLLGHRDDASSLLAASDVFIFPSRFEGLPGALIEAEAAGLPIICSDIANNREVVEENKNALFFPLNNPTELQKQILKLLKDKTLQKNMGLESLSIYKSNFLLEAVHVKMKKMIDRLIAA
jgi:glycosyltransferase involved in cell wall biosynthesis